MGNTCSIDTESKCGLQCTGYDGSHRWQRIHEEVAGIECDACRDHAVKMMSGVHDHVNAGIGEKELYDEDNYRDFVNEVNCVYRSYCKRTGRC